MEISTRVLQKIALGVLALLSAGQLSEAASILTGRFDLHGGCTHNLAVWGRYLFGDGRQPFAIFGLGQNDPTGCSLVELEPGRTYRENFLAGGGIMSAEFNFLNGQLYPDSVVYFGEILFNLPRLSIPDISVPLLNLSGLTIEYLIHFKAWETWDDFCCNNTPPIFDIDARGWGRARRLTFEGHPDSDGRWLYDFTGASVDLFQSVPEPGTWGLTGLGVLALGIRAAVRRRRPRPIESAN